MANNIIGNHDGNKGGNDTYNISGRGSNFTITVINGEKYAKAKPNIKTNDNINRS
jgi:hypothetical protein